MALLDSILDSLRTYAATRDGVTPMASRFGGMAAPSGGGATIDAPMLGGDAQDFTTVPGVGSFYSPPADPFAADDKTRAAAAARVMPNQAPLPFAGMLAGANGGPGAATGAFKPAMMQAPAVDPWANVGSDGGVTPNATGPVPFAARSVAMANTAVPGSGDTTTISAHRPSAPAPVAAGPVLPNNPPGASFLERVSNALASHPNTLLALGAGLSGAPSFGQGMSRAFAGAAAGGKMDLLQNMQTQGIQASYKALIGQGVPPHEALAAVFNPEVMKNIVPRYFGGAHWGIVGYDQDGIHPIYGFINEGIQTVTPGDQVAVPSVKSPEDVIRLPKGQRFTYGGHIYIR